MPTVHPTAFISYAWDADTTPWVKQLATLLRRDGVDCKLDQWELVHGDQLAEFMERSVRESDFVLIVCTPKYKMRSEGRIGGVGYEGDIMTAEILTTKNHRKFIPILRSGNPEISVAAWLSGKVHVDLRGDFPSAEYQSLVRTIYALNEKAPSLGDGPTKVDSGSAAEDRQQMKDIQQPVWKSSSFIGDGELLTRLIPFGRIEKAQNIVWHNGPQMFLRIIPLTLWKHRSPKELLDLLRNRNLSVSPLGGADYLWHSPNKYGAVVFDAHEDRPSAYRFTQVFKNGEIWGVDRFLLGHDARETKTVALKGVTGILQVSLPNYLQFAETVLKLKLPLQIIVGISGVENYLITLPSPIREGANIMDDEVIHSQRIESFGQAVEEIESRFVDVLLEACGLA